MSSRKKVLIKHQIYPYSVSEIEDKYLEWVSEDKYMIINRVRTKKVQVRDSRKNKIISVDFLVESDYFALKCSKRGNDVY